MELKFTVLQIWLLHYSDVSEGNHYIGLVNLKATYKGYLQGGKKF